MSISGIGNSSSYDPTQMARAFFRKADQNGDGSIDKSELKTALSQGSKNGKGAQDIDKIFAEADTDGNGKIDETENANQMKKMGAKGGTPPGGTGGAPSTGDAQKSTVSSGSSSSSSNKVYDKKDTNKDGTVSYQEEFDYNLKHPEEVKESSSNTQKTIGYNKTGNSNTGSEDSESRIGLKA
jgi:Ca2+-binding EF-hand superfamily protein